MIGIPNEKPTIKNYVSSDVKFYTIEDMQRLTGWSENTIQKLFNDPSFPASNYGRAKIVEAHALITFFSIRHEKSREVFWKSFNAGG